MGGGKSIGWMLRGWLVMLGLASLSLVAASCAQTGSAVAGAAAAEATATAAQTAATAAAKATTQAAEAIATHAEEIEQAVATGQIVNLPQLPDDGQTVVVNMPTATYIRFHGQQYLIPKPKPPANNPTPQ